ncbi:MAG: phosphoserine phosphatase [Methylophagaceae bacterium]|jgi:phosphoserine phosphatase
MTTWVLQGQLLTTSATHQIAEQLLGKVEERTHFHLIQSEKQLDLLQLQTLREQYDFDINVIPELFVPNEAALLVTDMDSTLISIECVDEIADFINAKPQVSAITEAAMRGEIDFETSLRQRVALLEGLDVSVLEQVFEQRLSLNPGAEIMLAGLKEKGIKTALVSGGFTFFTERLKLQLGLDYTLANVLGQHRSKLTGEIEGSICGAQAKADFLLQQCKNLGLSPTQAVAMGDGANDLLMMQEAGLSVAYHAKPTVQSQASTRLNYCGLNGVLGLLQSDFN